MLRAMFSGKLEVLTGKVKSEIEDAKFLSSDSVGRYTHPIVVTHLQMRKVGY